jgi:hypothetical protein
MKNETYTVIDETEFVDFTNILQEYGYLVDDFNLNEVDNTECGSLESTKVRLRRVVGVAIVIRTSNGVTRQYKAGDNSAWVVNFQGDLSAGIFGEP